MTALKGGVEKGSFGNRRWSRARCAVIAASTVFCLSAPAWSLSEFIVEDFEPPAGADQEIRREPLPPPPDFTIPLPDPVLPVFELRDRIAEPPDETPDEALPPLVQYDPDTLPDPVRETRSRLMEIAGSGDIEALSELIEDGSDATQFSLGPPAQNPVAYLRSISGDPEGHEILAILYEVLASGFVHLDADGEDEIFLWPYFFVMPLEELDGRQRVELFKLVTAGDYEDMKAYGGYLFYRTGIAPDGRWVFFLAGH
ncbi:MAG: hypothetical protein ACK4F5_14765 [Aliihoeflea sp.]